MATADTVHNGRGTPSPASLALLLATALLALFLAAAHHARPAPFGDRLTVHPAARHARGAADAPARLHLAPDGLEAYDPATGARRWTYARTGHRPLQARTARDRALALWDDGLVTGTALHDGALSVWHRGVPGAAARPARLAALHLLGPQPGAVAVVTPQLITAYGPGDGGLRWHREAGPGCAFDPARTAHRAGVLLIARHCAPGAPWTSCIAAVSEAGPFA
ncbi:hypothetical protein [Streptomyces hiroshimensis]|uniref:Uncharacterized protein n=1 Tax=Streptomyces hiroshimensis TaxID=66424 RepID=A0ABQ2YWC6_9ACTN|nr:hypothetical protein [Streptomyces hiroshimensis]GGX94506.1 hypothetical protein GCM10010324_45450 [Streptomyces hiroshimensis]